MLSDAVGYSVDFLLTGTRIVLEVDGPFHFLHSEGQSRAGRIQPLPQATPTSQHSPLRQPWSTSPVREEGGGYGEGTKCRVRNAKCRT